MSLHLPVAVTAGSHTHPHVGHRSSHNTEREQDDVRVPAPRRQSCNERGQKQQPNAGRPIVPGKHVAVPVDITVTVLMTTKRLHGEPAIIFKRKI